MTEAQSDLEALRRAQPSWRAEGIGVRGNAVDFQKEQARVDWPGVTLARRGAGPGESVATPGSPEAPTSVPAG